MNRTARYKLLYLVVVGGLVGLLAVLAVLGWIGWRGLVVVALLFLIPSRLQGYFWRDFFRGRRLLGQGEFAACLPYFERFLRAVRARPGLKRLIWLSWGMYTRDVEAMTLNNIGAARLSLGELEAAASALEEALAVDPASPLPHHNLALLCQVRGEGELAAEHLARARALGYRGGGSDRLVRSAGELLARIEGRGTGE